MITREYEMIVVECDGCGGLLETGEKDFEQARKAWAAKGWSNRRSASGLWRHFCPNCEAGE